jgi:hypothetical protein
MLRLLLFIHHIAVCTPCITHLALSHTYACAIDHAEPEPQESTEQAQVEAITNLALDQGKAWCIPPKYEPKS